jgi:glycosyltransferase involved in cell wall biosynthesis
MPRVPAAGPLRALFLNQGTLGSGVLGHGRVEESIQRGLEREPGVTARFIRLAPWGPGARALGGRWPGLHEAGLDFNVLRWYLTDGMRGALARRRAERRAPADVVHVHTHSLAFTMSMAGAPTVLSTDSALRDWQALGKAIGDGPRHDAELELAAALERRALRRSALVLAWTNIARRGVEAACPDARIAVHHPGIDAVRYSPPPGGRERSGRVLFVGGRFEQKGGLELLEALGHRLGRDLELDVVTPGPVPQRPGVTVHRLQPGAPELVELYRRADVMCLPSARDAVPFAVLEAMACGTPVVSSQAGSLPELVQERGAGLSVPAKDVGALRTALERVIDDDELRAGMGAVARTAIERDFDTVRQVPRLFELLREAAGVRRADRGL